MRLWRLGSRECIKIVREHTRPVDAIARRGKEIYTGDSMGRIKQWTLSLDYQRDLDGHETSVAGLLCTEEGLWSGRLCSDIANVVSMDKTAKLGKLKLEHASYVRAITATNELIVTGCEDEDIYVWDGDKLLGKVTGHCAGVTCLQVWKGLVISGSLDATLRFWTRQGRCTCVKVAEHRFAASQIHGGILHDGGRGKRVGRALRVTCCRGRLH